MRTISLCLYLCLIKICFMFGSEDGYIQVQMLIGSNTHAIQWQQNERIQFSVSSNCSYLTLYFYRQSMTNSLVLSKSYEKYLGTGYYNYLSLISTFPTAPIYLYLQSDSPDPICNYTIKSVSLNRPMDNSFMGIITYANRYFFQSVALNNFYPTEDSFSAQIMLDENINITACAVFTNSSFRINSMNESNTTYYSTKYWTFLPLTSCDQKYSWQNLDRQFYYCKTPLRIKYSKDKYSIAVAVVPPIAALIIIVSVRCWLRRCPPACWKKNNALSQSIINGDEGQMQARVYYEMKGLMRKSSSRSLFGLYHKQTEITCSVCLDENCDAGLPCFHLFHSTCIKEWLGKRQGCPICRKNYRLQDIILDIMS